MASHETPMGRPEPAEASSRTRRTGRAPQWRSLEELAGDESFREVLEYEFPSEAARWLDEPSRRRFLRLMGASLALSGMAGCAVQPLESIVPYVEQPELITPGKPLFFATAVPLGGFGTGVIVESHEGRPIKLEGNPTHPASVGATDVFSQAAVLSLYDPDRSQVVLASGRVSTWDRFLNLTVDLRASLRRTKGKGLRILTRSVTSPTLADQLQRLLKEMPQAKWHCYEPVCRDALREGTRLAFGEPLEPMYDLRRADVIAALDADFLGCGHDALRLSRDFADRRDPDATGEAGRPAMNRLYAVECTPTLTGAMADHRLPLPARDVVHVARALARALKVEGAAEPDAARLGDRAAWVSALARDLERARGRCLVVAGETQPAEVQALACLMNHALGDVGKAVHFHPIQEQGPASQAESLAELVRDMRAGAVETLLVMDANPVYEAPADLDFASALGDKVRLRIHLGMHENETGQLCDWHLPQSHFLESWGDLRSCDGTATIQQPMIAPLYQGRSPHEVVAALLGEPGRPGLEIVRDYWKRQWPQGEFEKRWRQALTDGVVAGTASKPKDVSPKTGPIPATAPPDQGGLELVFRPDSTIWDGRFANNGWLQELPKPLIRLTWDNAAMIGAGLAARLKVSNGDVVRLRYKGRAVEAPAWIMPGQPDETVTVTLGYGRWKAGSVGTGNGYNAYALRTSDAPWSGGGLEVEPAGRRHELATTQQHFNMAGRDLVRAASLEEYRAKPDFARESDSEHANGLSLYPERPRGLHAENAWGMAIDLNRCIGCGACVVACQAENNIPIVGKEEVLRSREMHWLRIDRYYEGDDPSSPNTYFQPVPCMHCEKAPCEVVCPVGATTHSDEGINEMTYNRCVGTRYCSNNCPYKVRRFNFLEYNDNTTPSLKLLRNPDVTVRSRGVMEKCTYCVQRVNNARIRAKIEGRPVGGDEVETACQAACPARAIIFGNQIDPESQVAKLKASPRNYALLADLNTWPRTTYLARLRNPNPEIEPRGAGQGRAEPSHDQPTS